jgi:hypothetical protein
MNLNTISFALVGKANKEQRKAQTYKEIEQEENKSQEMENLNHWNPPVVGIMNTEDEVEQRKL